jgi:hypothetical protein
LKHLCDETQKPWIVDLFGQDAHHDGVVTSVNTGFSVAFPTPVAPCPRVFTVAQCRVTASFRSRAMSVFAEWRLVRRLSHAPNHVLETCVGPRRQTSSTHVPVFLGYKGSSNGSPAGTLVTEILEDLPTLFERHGIRRFLC